MELEAEIVSKLALIYEKVLKLIDKSKFFYYACFNLAEAMKPKSFNNKSWYIRCSNAIKSYQQVVVDEEEKRIQIEKDKIFDQIKDDLSKIKNEADKNDQVLFIQFIYANYPPKNNKSTKCPAKESMKTSVEIKKAYKNALIHYHPDKNLSITYGFDWYKQI